MSSTMAFTSLVSMSISTCESTCIALGMFAMRLRTAAPQFRRCSLAALYSVGSSLSSSSFVRTMCFVTGESTFVLMTTRVLSSFVLVLAALSFRSIVSGRKLLFCSHSLSRDRLALRASRSSRAPMSPTRLLFNPRATKLVFRFRAPANSFAAASPIWLPRSMTCFNTPFSRNMPAMAFAPVSPIELSYIHSFLMVWLCFRASERSKAPSSVMRLLLINSSSILFALNSMMRAQAAKCESSQWPVSRAMVPPQGICDAVIG
mmetsp:Transcript_39252/g.76171  ORF Transcript_39252/g.76171 Transcript_39252/m.76171 type:complete len:261 (-) Transcript_39252:1247-2029(-)